MHIISQHSVTKTVAQRPATNNFPNSGQETSSVLLQVTGVYITHNATISLVFYKENSFAKWLPSFGNIQLSPTSVAWGLVT